MLKAFHRQSPLRKNLITAALVLCTSLLFYITANKLTGSRLGVTFVTPIDAVIPFFPAAIFGFLFFIPLFAFPFLLIPDRLVVRRISWGIVICTVLVLAVFFVFPTRVPRPGIPTQENFLYWLVAFLYVSDNPVNCLPGFSLTIGIFITFCMWSVAHTAGWVSLAATTVVVISSLLVHQHYLADVLASLIIGYCVYRFFVHPVIRNGKATDFTISSAQWQKLALHMALIYLGFIGAGLLLFETGLRFNPVLPTN